MKEQLYSQYKTTETDAPLRSIFDKLAGEFSEDFQVWIRIEDFDRRVSAAILNTKSQTPIAVIGIVRKSGRTCEDLGPTAIAKMRKHLSSGTDKDLELSMDDMAT